MYNLYLVHYSFIGFTNVATNHFTIPVTVVDMKCFMRHLSGMLGFSSLLGSFGHHNCNNLH